MPEQRRKIKIPSDLPATLPVFPLPGAILLPRGNLPLNIFEPRYLAMVDDALSSSRLIGMVQPSDPESGAAKPPVYGVGCAGRLTAFSETGDGRYLITLTGICRFRVTAELEAMTQYRQVRADWSDFEGDLQANSGDLDVDRDRLLSALKAYLQANDLKADWDSINAAPNEPLINSLSMIAPVDVPEKQALLEAATTAERAEVLIKLIEISLAEGTGGGGDITLN